MSEYMIALDAMGGDNAPQATCAGAVEALRENSRIRIRLYGREDVIKANLGDYSDVASRLDIIHTTEEISMEDAPMLAVRRKTDSSLVRAAMDVREGTAQALVSAGSTGAGMACGILRIGRIQGVERPALGVLYPGVEKTFLILDSGANVDCQPKYLSEFGLMGAAFMSPVTGISDPEVRLLNNGAEETKGSKLYKEAHQMMKEQKAYRFTGNIESRDVPFGKCDVVVCDGFDGNILIKLTEGIASAMFGLLKQSLMATTAGKIGGMLIKPSLKGFKKHFDSEEVGGAPLLGVSAPVVKAHGSSHATAIKNAVFQAFNMIKGDVCGKIAQGMEKITASSAEAEERMEETK